MGWLVTFGKGSFGPKIWNDHNWLILLIIYIIIYLEPPLWMHQCVPNKNLGNLSKTNCSASTHFSCITIFLKGRADLHYLYSFDILNSSWTLITSIIFPQFLPIFDINDNNISNNLHLTVFISQSSSWTSIVSPYLWHQWQYFQQNWPWH